MLVPPDEEEAEFERIRAHNVEKGDWDISQPSPLRRMLGMIRGSLAHTTELGTEFTKKLFRKTD